MTAVPLHDRFFNPLDSALIVDRSEDVVTLRLDAAFVGRDVEETFTTEELGPITVGDARNDDALGLVLESNGEWIHLLVGVGSGNERFAVSRSRFAAALDA